MNVQTISHYRVTERLEAGGMGVVYKAFELIGVYPSKGDHAALGKGGGQIIN